VVRNSLCLIGEGRGCCNISSDVCATWWLDKILYMRNKGYLINEEGGSGMKGLVTSFHGSLMGVGFFHLNLDGNKVFVDGVEYFLQIFCLGLRGMVGQ